MPKFYAIFLPIVAIIISAVSITFTKGNSFNTLSNKSKIILLGFGILMFVLGLGLIIFMMYK